MGQSGGIALAIAMAQMLGGAHPFTFQMKGAGFDLSAQVASFKIPVRPPLLAIRNASFAALPNPRLFRTKSGSTNRFYSQEKLTNSVSTCLKVVDTRHGG